MSDSLVLITYLLLLFACVFEVLKHRFIAVTFLFTASLVAGYWAIGLDPFLNDWDERYHALVAKNLTSDMLHPTLFKTPLIPYNFKDWSGNYTWIHKQPMFLWLISISIKFFGAVEKAVRMPSLIMVSIMVLMIYRMAKLLSNQRVAFISALLITCHYTYLQNMSGIFLVDHNNIAFLFFITASFTFWIEFEFSRKSKWLYWMGLAVGCAVLVKWLVGLLVFAPFGLLHLFIKRDMFSKNVAIPLLKSLTLVSLVAIPWQLYCYLHFPNEFLFEMSFNAKHIWQALEGHEGGWDFYFKNLSTDYEGLYWLIIPSALSLLFIKQPYRYNQLLLLSATIVYLFFTLVATKMPQYVIIASPFLLYGMALFVDKLFSIFEKQFAYKFRHIASISFICICLLLAHFNFSFKIIEGWHWRNIEEAGGRYKEYKIYCKQYFKELNKIYDPENSVIVFCSNNIDCMFYSDFIAYNWVDKNNLEILKKSGRKILIFNNLSLPEFVKSDSTLLLLNNETLN